MLDNVFSHYVNKNFLFFPMHSFLLKQHHVRLLFCIIILSEKKSSQSTFMIKLLISRTIVPFRQIVISYFILYQLTANADYMQLKHQKDGVFFVPKKSSLVLTKFSKSNEKKESTKSKHFFASKVVTFCGKLKNMCVCCCIS